ncbi:MAG: cupin domain-containing protein [Candidatus Poribacteria bacterium]|nr:cupin domain-containing protein [Candidatus Poribacteria bacterium]MDE0503139.1 cupin domain-containing protein [Candidatus Poribacteria bacterium]
MAEATGKSFAAHASDATWKEGLRSYMAYRGLGITEATNGKVMAHVIRANEPCNGPMGYHYHDLEFQLNYLIKGTARVYLEDIGEIQLAAGDAWYQAPNVKHEVLEYSDDFEVLEITMPADFPTHEIPR